MPPKETVAELRAGPALPAGQRRAITPDLCYWWHASRDLELMTPLGRGKPETKAELKLKGSSVQEKGEL